MNNSKGKPERSNLSEVTLETNHFSLQVTHVSTIHGSDVDRTHRHFLIATPSLTKINEAKPIQLSTKEPVFKTPITYSESELHDASDIMSPWERVAGAKL
jgi:hypothetical protein